MRAALEKLPNHDILNVDRIEQCQLVKRLRGQFANGCIPVHDFTVDQMINQAGPVLGILSHKQAKIQVGILTQSDSKVVARGEDIDAVRKRSLAANMFLKSRRSSSTAIDLIKSIN